MSSHTPPNQASGPYAPLPECTFPQWIEDDGRLRDEGIVFGLSGTVAGMEAKERSIRSYYDRRIAETERELPLLREAVPGLRDRRTALRQEIEALTQDRSELNRDERALSEASRSAARYYFGALSTMGVCGFSYFIVLNFIGSRFQHPEAVSAGITLTGLFAVFYTSDGHEVSPSGWKERLAEFGTPLATAAFVVAWDWQQRGLARSVAAFLFLSMLFLVSGRLLYSMVSGLSVALRGKAELRRLRRRGKLLENEIQQLRRRVGENDEEEKRIWLRCTLLPSATELNAECDRKQALLRSEYEFIQAADQNIALPGLHSLASVQAAEEETLP